MPRTLLKSLSLLLMLATWCRIPTAQAEPLTLREAVRRAIERSPTLLAARDNAEAASRGVEQARSTNWPRLVLSSSYRYSGPVAELTIDTGMVLPGSTEPLVITNEIGTPHNASIGLQASWRAWDWGVREAMADAARASASAASAEEDGRAVELAYAVRVSYLASVYYGVVDEITGRALETARRQLEDRTARYQAGLGPQVEVASASARVAELEARQVDAQGQREVAVGTLYLLIGRESNQPLELVDSLEVLAETAAMGQMEEHPSLAQLASLAAAIEEQAQAVRRSFWPTLDLFLSTNYQFPRTFVDTEEAGFAYAAGVMLTWELFDGFMRSHREEELMDRVSATLHLEEARREELLRGTLEARSRQQAAAAALEAARRQRQAAEVYLQAAQAAWEAGMGTSLDVLTAEGAVDAARLAENRALFGEALAVADLLRATGVSSMEVGQ